MVENLKLPIQKKLQLIHEEVISKYALKEKATKDAEIARQMELLLRRLKMVNRNPEDEVDQQLQQIVRESVGILSDNRGSNLTETLFKRAHGVKTTYGGDDIFEEEFAAVLATIEKNATGTTIYNIEDRLVGGESANILGGSLEDIALDTLNQYEKRIRSRVLKDLNKGNKDYTNVSARSGKVDIKGFDMTVEATLAPEWEELYNLFKGKTFSLKNYSSFVKEGATYQKLDIHLGNTNLYKALYAVLSDMGYSSTYIDKVFFSGVNAWYNSSNEAVKEHFYHLRFIYELTGVGLYDSEGNPLSGVDFFVYNDPNSDNIFVRSTAEMISNEIEKTGKVISGGIFSGIKIAKKSFG